MGRPVPPGPVFVPVSVQWYSGESPSIFVGDTANPSIRYLNPYNGDETVVVVFDRMRVVNRWAFAQGQPPTDAQVADILAAADKVGASGK